MKQAANIPEWLYASDIKKSAAMPAWLLDFKQQQWETFHQKGLPTRKTENWKYASIPNLNEANLVTHEQNVIENNEATFVKKKATTGFAHKIVLQNGHLNFSLSDLEALPENVVVSTVAEALTTHEDLIKSSIQSDATSHPFLLMNNAMFLDGLFVCVPSGVEIKGPIHVLHLSDSNNKITPQHKVIIVLGENSRANIVEEYVTIHDSASYTNVATHIELKENASLQLCKVQNENLNTTHIAYTHLVLNKSSQAVLNYFSKGSLFARDDLQVDFNGEQAICRAAGFYTSKEKQYVDYHLDFKHQAANTSSEMMFKGVVADQSKAVFNGRLHVIKGAQRIAAKQTNHHILLSSSAEAYSKPELEIYADDVKCQHGATTGQLDQEALFFLRSRGIGKEQAVKILLQGFAADVLKNIACPYTMDYIKNQIELGV